jgi:succinate dehydrogenase/fumarate reductase flavoprotein subunit
MADDEAELKVGGFTFKGVYLAAALPLLGSLSGGIYYGYDVVNRFWGVEDVVSEVISANEQIQTDVLDVASRIQALEQTIGDNNVSGLNTQLSQISTQMVSILEQQKTLLDLRSKVERAELITDGIDDKLEQLQTDIDSTWDAIDELGKPL